MRYWLNRDCSLESWQDTGVRAIFHDGRELALSAEERLFLLHCDGSDCAAAACAEKLIADGVVSTQEEYGKLPQLELHAHLHRSTAVIGITGHCNYQCRHCIAAAGTQKERDELSLEEISSLFAQMADLGIGAVWLTGGEPLIHPDFAGIIEAASTCGIRITRILTNGSLLDEGLLAHLRRCGQNPQFGISFDGLGTHDWMRCKPGAEEASLAAIDLARSLGFDVNPHINVNNITAPRLIETCRALVQEHDCKQLRLIPTSRSPRWEALAQDGDNISYDDYFALMLEVIRTAHNEKWNAYLDLRSLPQVHNAAHRHLLERLKKPAAVHEKRPIMHTCTRTAEQIFVAHDGRVLPCNAYEGTSKQYGFLVGDDINIRNRSLADILTDSEYVRVCTEPLACHLRDRVECQSCKWMGLCGGGCPLFALGNRRGLADENPNCAFFKGGWADRYIALLEELGL